MYECGWSASTVLQSEGFSSGRLFFDLLLFGTVDGADAVEPTLVVITVRPVCDIHGTNLAF